MIENPKDGDIVYHCLPSVESENAGHYAPVMPHPAKLARNVYGVIHAFYFNSETGEKDYDTNAYARVKPEDLFETMSEAEVAYLVAREEYAKDKIREALEYLF